MLTTRPYIRTVSEVQVGWYVFVSVSFLFRRTKRTERGFLLDRLSEYAPTYFDLSTFPDGEMKRALERAKNKGKAVPDGKKKVKAQQLDGSDNITKVRKKAKHGT